MKRKITFLLAAMLLMSGLTWAQTTINWAASEQGYQNAQEITSVTFDDNVSGTFAKGTNNNAPKYYTSGAAIRCYGGNYFTITSDYDLTQIVLSFASGEGSNAITTNVGTYENGTWTGSANEITFTIGGTSGHRRIASFAITYSTGGAPTCATPTFSPAAGTYAEAQEVTISCTTDNATVYYTLDGNEPTIESSVYSDPINISETTTVKAMAVAEGYNNSSVASATYTFVTIVHEGTADDPYTVADAHAAIDANVGTQDVYATGIVSTIVTAYNSTYGNITFDIVDEEGDEAYLRAYRCAGDEAANVTVGDVVVVSGNLTKYNEIYEFVSGCQVVSLEHPAVLVEAPTFSPEAGFYTEAQTVTISTATEAADIYYTLDGTDPDMNSTMYGAPIVVSTTTTIKAVAVDGNDNLSSVASATYTIVPESNISGITEVGTAYNVRGTVVATNSRGFIMGDGTGYVYTYLNSAPTQAVGDMVNILGTTGQYGHIIQFTSSATIAEATESNYNGEPEYTVITEVPDYSEGYHLSDYFQFEGTLSKEISGNYTNYNIAVGEGTIRISYPTNDQVTALEDLLDKTVRVHGFFAGISGTTFTAMMESVEEVVSTEPSITLNTPVSIPAEGGLDIISVEYVNIDDTYYPELLYYNENQEQVDASYYDWITLNFDDDDNVQYNCDPNTNVETRSIYFKVLAHDYNYNEVTSNLVTLTQDAYVAAPASITVTPNEVNATVEGQEGTLTVTYENITEVAAEVYFCDANGEAATYDWITAEINSDNNVDYLIEANEGEARTAYFKVFATGDEDFVYSNLVTVSQAAFAIDYAILPFHWLGGTKDELLANQGVTAFGLGSDYAASNAPYRVKFDGTGDYIQVKTNTNPDYVTIDVKMLGGSNTSTITVQASADGETFDEGEVLTISGKQNDIVYLATTRSFDESVRYIRLYFTKGSNVGVGPISIGNYETYNLTINGYGQSEGGYSLIASPVYVNPENTGMITDDGTDPENYTYDLYFFDQTQEEEEWRNYREETFNLVPGKGYLYANKAGVELTFTGIPYSGDGIITLVKDDNAAWAGWNLVGNPFSTAAYLDRDFYIMNEAGTGILPDACTGAVEAMQGVFVIAEQDGETLTFTNQAPEAAANVTLNLTQNRGAVIDRAIVRFNEGRQLPKFQLNAESTKLYIPQGNNDYAVVRSAANGEMPVNFKAQSNGTYTISVDAENAEASYLHLIDNMTGNDIDLLATPSYTFEATTSDYASRFRLVFNVTGVEENTTGTEPFAFFNGSEWVVSNIGNATLQMVDLTGRILSSESINGNATVGTSNLSAGIYLMRLVNGNDVKTQKVVVR